MISVIFSQYHNFLLSIINNLFYKLNYQFYSIIIFIFLIYVFFNFRCYNFLKKNNIVIFLIFFFCLEYFSYLQGDIDLVFVLGVFLMAILLLNENFKSNYTHNFLLINLCIIFFITIFEIAFNQKFNSIINQNSYFENTRLWYEGVDTLIYQGSLRAGGNFLTNYFNYRASSIFLEPLNLGYFGYLNFLFFNFLRLNENSSYNLKYTTITFICLFLIIVSDTRSAMLLFFLTLVIPKKIFYLNNFTIIFIFLFSLLLLLLNNYLPDYVKLRLSYNIISSENTILHFLNFAPSFQKDNDSTYILIFNNLGLFGYLFLLIFLGNFMIFVKKKLTNENTIKFFFHNIFLYFFFLSMFGGAMFSIKNLLLLILMINYVFMINKFKNVQ